MYPNPEHMSPTQLRRAYSYCTIVGWIIAVWGVLLAIWCFGTYEPYYLAGAIFGAVSLAVGLHAIKQGRECIGGGWGRLLAKSTQSGKTGKCDCLCRQKY